jgi:hypothetical protein
MDSRYSINSLFVSFNKYATENEMVSVCVKTKSFSYLNIVDSIVIRFLKTSLLFNKHFAS